MKEGMALINGWSGGLGDFDGDKEGCTLSPDSKKVKMVPCWKCPKCGHSISKECKKTVGQRSPTVFFK